ncbi:dihydrolipoyl dehydrogenase [Hoeflea sp.]|uniref:dihydrolipoyl dehydrogenase n=1 Tax=Hoeflea sp. TaxID=1940281 RepID=UPI002AFEC913|nr:dihydrolipoyl dehydrogenase [Hoeflea sp.]
MAEIVCKLLIIGGGPGGYVTAIRAAQLGIDTLIVDEGPLGGTCLNIGCIPSKALIHAGEEFHKLAEAATGGSPFGLSAASPAIDLGKTMAWKDGIVTRLTGGVAGLLKKAGAKSLRGRASIRDGKTVTVETDLGPQTVHAETIVIATGSEPVELPSLPFGGKVISSTGALALTQLPESLVVVGGGYIGLEIGTAYAKLGVKVTVVEAAPRILPVWDAELTGPVAKRLAALGVEVMTGAKVTGLADDGETLQVATADGSDITLAADKILVAVGRRLRTQGFGLEQLALPMDGPFIRIDNQCRTAMRGVYAIGDVTGEPMLAHRAMAQGEMVADLIAGQPRVWDKRAIPAVCFTDPEIVSVGLGPDAARRDGQAVLVGTFPFRANGRAMSLAREDGFVRVIAREDNHVVLGIEAVGAGVAEFASAFSLAIEMGARLEDIADTIHAHPTMGEAIQESALTALGRGLHL